VKDKAKKILVNSKVGSLGISRLRLEVHFLKGDTRFRLEWT
jgi:hypothetical protein